MAFKFADALRSFFAVITKNRKSVRSYLWSTWMAFFLACIAVSMFALLIWKDETWGVTNCTFGSDGKATNCQGPQLWVKIVASVVAAYGLVIQLCESGFSRIPRFYD